MKLVIYLTLTLITVSWSLAQKMELTNYLVTEKMVFNSALIEWIEKVNKIDRYNLVGKRIIIPLDSQTFAQYCPADTLIKEWQHLPQAILVNTGRQAQYYGAYEYGRLVYWGPICSGRPGKSTPKGNFKVLSKIKNAYSRKYRCAMPYALRLKGNKIFMHQCPMVGRPASHGCIRQLKKDAIWLFNWAKINTYVKII